MGFSQKKSVFPLKDGKGSIFAAESVRNDFLSSMCPFFTYKEILFQTIRVFQLERNKKIGGKGFSRKKILFFYKLAFWKLQIG